ncbi:hypothetical protein VXM60_03450 [Shewanella khirikhana]|uniref:hypothetical protein n=1 Tax=Shewanella khirikhana TaxID=1965282 RepID=UPI0030D2B4E4
MAQKHKLALAVALAVGFGSPAIAEWSNDPANSAILVTNKGNTPQIVADSKGGVYVSYRNDSYYWRNPNNSGFDVFVQHYNANGIQSWPEPVRAFDTSKQFASYYGTAIDEDDNVYIANDIYPSWNPHENSTVQIAKINNEGNFVWETPLNLTPNADYWDNGLGITMDAKGSHIVAAWARGYTSATVDGFSVLAGLTKDGEMLWQKEIQISEGRYTFATKPIIIGDSVMVLLEIAGQTGSSRTHYYLQKYALSDGSPKWAEPVAITSGANFDHPIDSALHVRLLADGEGGVLMSWYHSIGYNEGMLMLQHVNAEGRKKYPGQGLRFSGELRGNATPHMTDDGQNTYLVWPVHKKDIGEDELLHDYSAVRGVAISRSGELLWDTDDAEPKYLLPWRQWNTEGYPNDDWFKGYQDPQLIFNQNGKLNLTYGEETNFAYYLQAQVINPVNGETIGDVVPFSNGPVEVAGTVSSVRTTFGQPVMAFPYSYGPIRLVNFDGTGHSGVSQDVLIEQVPTQFLSPGEQKQLSLKLLDNVSSDHNASIESASEQVSAELTNNISTLDVTLSTDSLLTDNIAVTVTAEDQNAPLRTGSGVINVRTPLTMPPVITPMADQQMNEADSLTVAAEVQAMDYTNLEVQWEQTAGPVIEYQAEGTSLTLNSHYVAEDTLVSFTITATDGEKMSSQSVNVMVKNTVIPTISGGDTSATPGMPFSITPTISGALAPVSLNWTQASGANTVYTVAADGTLNGTAPLTTGTVTLSLHAVDANGQSFSHDFNVNVDNPEQPSSGGGMGWLGVLLGMLAIPLRRSGKTEQHKI